MVEQPTSVKNFINDEKCKQTALESAQQIINLMGKDWFTVINLCQVMQGVGLAEMIVKLDALKLFGFIYEKTVEGKENEYKVTLTDGHRLKLLIMDVEFYITKLKIINKEIARLKEKIKKTVN